MHNQPKYRPLRASAFFEDTSSARPLLEGTIARGTLQTDAAFFTGKNGAMLVTELPFPVTQAVLDRGQERFNIYCTPCHDQTGSGNGLVVQRGYPKPQTYHSDRLRNIEIGYFFDVMTNGFGRMPDYRAQISPRDRWNIAATSVRCSSVSTRRSLTSTRQGFRSRQRRPRASTARRQNTRFGLWQHLRLPSATPRRWLRSSSGRSSSVSSASWPARSARR
jgi:hypothetical protein